MGKAYFAAGCFWGVEARFKENLGVESTTVGYMGGETLNPTYKEVCSGSTGHAEVVEVVFNSAKTSFETLTRLFFEMHNPTTLDRQGLDIGSQYRSAIFFVKDEQAVTVKKIIAELTEAKVFSKAIVTTLEPLTQFYTAEEYHQDYLDKNPGVCHI